ncbi:MAG: hypothetical protein AAB855_01095 [Patescibacteria group bacterium]
MTLVSLIEKARTLPIFSLEDCQKWFPNSTRKALILQLWRFGERGSILRLKRGLFLYTDPTVRIDPRVIASRLDARAVVSIETALHDAGITPEIPFAVTCITPGKTKRYHYPSLGTYIFRHIKPPLLFGWDVQTFQPYPVKIAHPEKALLDLFWFHRFEKDPSAYVNGLRLSLSSGFSFGRLMDYAKVFDNENVVRMVNAVRTLL